MILDCSSLDSTLTSLEPMLGLGAQAINKFIAEFDCEAYSKSHPNDHRPLKEILPELLRDRGTTHSIPDAVYWFHGTRVLDPSTLRSGLRPLHQQVDRLWQDLFQLAQSWVSREEWLAFRQKVETTDTLNSSNLHRQRLSNPADGEPHAVLIRDAIAAPQRFGGWNYLSAPETITDLCKSFESHYGHDLLARFRRHSVPCIVKVRDECRRQDLVWIALAYLWGSLHEESCITCNACFESNMNAVLPTAIEEVDTMSNAW